MGFFDIFRKDKRRKMIQSELRWKVNIEDESIYVKNPDGKKDHIRIEDIEVINIITTDEGPFAPDVWWDLRTKEKKIIFPQGAEGESEILDRAQKLPEFNNEVFIKAMTSAENMEFLCWKRI